MSTLFPQNSCKHESYATKTKVEVVKLKELGTYQMVAKVSVWCSKCGRPFTFHAKHGFSTYEPSVSNDEAELRIPIDYPEDAPVPPVPSVMH